MVAGCMNLSQDAVSTIPPRASDTPLVKFRDGSLPGLVKANNAVLTLIPNPGLAAGDQALEVALDSSSSFSGIVFQPETAWDWSQQGEFSLAFDIANTGDHSVQLYADVADQHAASQVRTAVIPRGARSTTYYIVLQGEEWKIDSGLRSDPPA